MSKKVIRSDNEKDKYLTKVITIPKDCTVIDKNAFSEYFNLEIVVIEGSISCIEEEAFKDCHCLKEVIGLSRVKSIKREAFKNCLNLKYIDYLDNLEFIGDSAFENCLALTEISARFIGNQNFIGSKAFMNCYSLQCVSLEAEGTKLTIQSDAFSNCVKLDRVAIGGLGLTDKIEFKPRVFKDCVNLVSCALAGNYNEISEEMFLNCNSFETFIHYASKKSSTRNVIVKPVKKQSFKNCSSLCDITLGSNIDEFAFCNCYSLQRINWLKVKKASLTVARGAFANCRSLELVDLTDAIKSIESYAFLNCYSVKTLSIEKGGLKSLKDKVFNNCFSLTDIYLGSVTRINSTAFEECTSIKSVLFDITPVSKTYLAFKDNPDVVIKVTENLLNNQEEMCKKVWYEFLCNDLNLNFKDNLTLPANEAKYNAIIRLIVKYLTDVSYTSLEKFIEKINENFVTETIMVKLLNSHNLSHDCYNVLLQKIEEKYNL